MTLRDRKTGEPLGLRDAGLVCRKCGCRHFHVIYVEQKNDTIKRRRECRHCQRRITTTERES